MSQLDTFWQSYVATLPEDHPHRQKSYVTSYTFGDHKAMRDELLALVLAETKTGTSGTVDGFAAEGEAIPQIGDLNIILDGDEQPACIVETTDVQIVPFNEVTAEFAYSEGEDDRSLASWRENHERFWKRVLPGLGLSFDPEMLVVCERFKLVYQRPDSAESTNKSMPEFMLTPPQIAERLREIGWQAGMTVLVHSSLSQIGGWIPGGTEGVIAAMLDVLGDEGTLVMPTFTSDNSEPSYWQHPPIPESWWQTVRETTPAFNPQTTPTRLMGILAENFRSWPGVLRSSHPQGAFAALGKHAATITANHDLQQQFGDQSPLGRIYDLDAYVFLLGVGHGNNTSLHLAEERMSNPKHGLQGSAMLVKGVRQWVTFETVDYDADDFEQIGADYEVAYPDAVRISTLGKATVRLMRQRPLVDFALGWLNSYRTKKQEA